MHFYPRPHFQQASINLSYYKIAVRFVSAKKGQMPLVSCRISSTTSSSLHTVKEGVKEECSKQSEQVPRPYIYHQPEKAFHSVVQCLEVGLERAL
jgi:hypothetical protein